VRHVGGKLQGKVLGKFRNTYYDFPAESEFKGASVALKNPSCETIKQVPRGFFEAVCVQGSGTLSNRQTVSFAKRDCGCAEVCPKTGQKICFDTLDPNKFPYGRGATGNPITPLYSVAVDTSVIPLGTTIYIPELDGMPRDSQASGLHDGCFQAQDRGLRVKGKHVDVFTGDPGMTRLWNKLVPSNQGVTVVLKSPRCAHAKTSTRIHPAASTESNDESSSKKKERRRRKRD
jgi:3D (Asp-Asp-Asp) domain-containing protein